MFARIRISISRKAAKPRTVARRNWARITSGCIAAGEAGGFAKKKKAQPSGRAFSHLLYTFMISN